jgi:disulfide bond formation protein DsbB
MTRLSAAQIALCVGAVSAALIVGALAFQYIGGYPPCEMCMWQRYPHFAAILVGLGGGALLSIGALPAGLAKPVAFMTILLIAVTGAIGVYHAGVEWLWWKGPSACTGQAFRLTGSLDLNAHVVSCDHAAWRMFGVSMAGYNAIISLGTAIMALFALSRAER